MGDLMFHVKQSGFINLSIMGWAAVAAGVVILGLTVALKVQSSRLETAQTETATAKAAAAQWQATALECSDSVEKASKAASEALQRSKAALAKARQGSVASQTELARLRGQMGKQATCVAAVQQIKQGLK